MESQASRMVTCADNRKPHIKSKITLIFFIVLVGLSPLKLYLKFVFIIVCGRAVALEIVFKICIYNYIYNGLALTSAALSQ